MPYRPSQKLQQSVNDKQTTNKPCIFQPCITFPACLSNLKEREMQKSVVRNIIVHTKGTKTQMENQG